MPDYKVRIQKNVPMPGPPRKSASRGRRPPEYPWDEMEIGDSFLFPLAINRSAYALAAQASKKGRLFIARTVENGIRCWRVK